MLAIGVDPSAILIEPAPRNTAPAVLAAALHLATGGPDRVMPVLPCDHAVPDAAAFRQAVARGEACRITPMRAGSSRARPCRCKSICTVPSTGSSCPAPSRVAIDGEARLPSENQSVHVPLGSVHRLENAGKVAVHLIGVQTGAYPGEDDITRFDDVYARGADV